MKKEKYVKICPMCGSIKTRIPSAGLDLHMTAPDYCDDCEFRGKFPEVKESEIDYFRKELNKKNK